MMQRVEDLLAMLLLGNLGGFVVAMLLNATDAAVLFLVGAMAAGASWVILQTLAARP